MSARNTKTTTSAATQATVRAAQRSRATSASAGPAVDVEDKLEAARAAHAAKKAAAPKDAKVKPTAATTELPELGAQEEQAHTAWAEFRTMFEDFKLPSGKRMLASVVTQFVIIASGVYSGAQVAAVLSLAAVALTGSAFLAFVAYFVAVALAVYGSLMLSARIGRYIALGEIDQDMARAKSWISDKFSGLRARLPGVKNEA